MNRYAIILFFIIGYCPITIAERLDDSSSPQQRINFQLKWAHAPDNITNNNIHQIIAYANNVEIRLNTAKYINKNARIYLHFQPLMEYQYSQKIRVTWVSRGILQSGSTTLNNRVLLYEGLVKHALFVDYWNIQFKLDSRYLTSFLFVEPIYEIEIF